jgi:hypothetical protein
MSVHSIDRLVDGSNRSGKRIGKVVAVPLVAPIKAGEVFLDHDLK